MAKSTEVPKTTSPVVGGSKTKKDKASQASYQQNLFLAMALNMTWQLAIVVIIPLVGGYKLDKHFNTSPVYTLIGLLMAVGGVAGILYRITAEASERSGYKRRGGKQ